MGGLIFSIFQLNMQISRGPGGGVCVVKLVFDVDEANLLTSQIFSV